MVQVPHPLDSLAPDLSGKQRAKPNPPTPNRFVADLDAAPAQGYPHGAPGRLSWSHLN